MVHSEADILVLYKDPVYEYTRGKLVILIGKNRIAIMPRTSDNNVKVIRKTTDAPFHEYKGKINEKFAGIE
jgi:hypothetical protein